MDTIFYNASAYRLLHYCIQMKALITSFFFIESSENKKTDGGGNNDSNEITNTQDIYTELQGKFSIEADT